MQQRRLDAAIKEITALNGTRFYVCFFIVIPFICDHFVC